MRASAGGLHPAPSGQRIFMEETSKQSLKDQVWICIDMVLATEMTKHFEHVNKFVNIINKPLVALEEDEVGERTANGVCV